jgi:hypothetical protein
MVFELISVLRLAAAPPAAVPPTSSQAPAAPPAVTVSAPAAPPQARAPGSGQVYRGRANELEVRIPRLEDEDIRIDGRLDEPAWREAAVLADFSQYTPVDGLPAPDTTEVRVWYSAHAIYFGIRAREAHGPVHATLADRDKIDGDDYVQVLLDTFHDGRRAFVFGVNPLGVQSDGIRSEGGGNAGHAFGDQSGLDLSPDFIYESKGHVTPDGYEVELRIPFKSLRYQSAASQAWGINIVRQVQHSGYQLTWTPAHKASASFLTQSGTLEGLSGLRRGLVLDLNPEATTKVEGAPGPGSAALPGGPLLPGAWRYQTSPEIGGNLRWGVTSNLSLAATANPDFSQVEADAGQIITDPRQALFFAEKRPFFLEGIEQFQTPTQLIYTRRIQNPIAAVKLNGKEGGTNIGLLSAVDEITGDDGVRRHPVFNQLRARRDLGDQNTAGLVYTDREDAFGYNRVAGADARIYFRKLYYAEFVAAGSLTRDTVGAPSRAAPLWNATVDRTGHNWGFHYVLEGSHPDFQAQSGFIARTGIAHFMFLNRFSAYGAPGATLENYTVYTNLDGTWDYRHFTAGRMADDISLSANNNFTLHGGWLLGATPALHSYSFPAPLFVDYALPGPGGFSTTATRPFTGTDRLSAADITLSLTTPHWKAFTGSGSLALGRDPNFDEWAPAWVEITQLAADWRPNRQLRIDPSFVHQMYTRTSDGSTVRVHRIPRLLLEYQLTRAIFFRFVGQYDSSWRDSLRDDSRTDAPILVRGSDGIYRATSQTASNGFRHDWLFSYQPTPGTVLFAGYGSSLDASAFTLRQLERTSDGFFFKVSYLFRM